MTSKIKISLFFNCIWSYKSNDSVTKIAYNKVSLIKIYFIVNLLQVGKYIIYIKRIFESIIIKKNESFF